jgi:hypothetical protein
VIFPLEKLVTSTQVCKLQLGNRQKETKAQRNTRSVLEQCLPRARNGMNWVRLSEDAGSQLTIPFKRKMSYYDQQSDLGKSY